MSIRPAGPGFTPADPTVGVDEGDVDATGVDGPPVDDGEPDDPPQAEISTAEARTTRIPTTAVGDGGRLMPPVSSPLMRKS